MRNLQRLVQIILLVRVAFVPALLMAQQEKMQPEKVYYITKQYMPRDWYRQQTELWHNEVSQNPKNGAAWHNYYVATEYSYLESNAPAERETRLAKILADMQIAIAGEALPDLYKYLVSQKQDEKLAKVFFYKNFSDEKLMELIQRKNLAGQEAFDELYGQCLLCYFHRMLGGQNDRAQDFLQDLFLKIVARPELFNPAQRFRTWVYTVAHNMCKNEYRRREVSKVVESTDNIEAPSAETENLENTLDQQFFQQALFLELEKLEENHRTTSLLWHQNDFSIKEISKVLGCSEGTTKSRLFYATKKLARQLSAFHPKGSEVQ